jgi:polysaccharide chain length determinant protein (PEP-CTERM system associated)
MLISIDPQRVPDAFVRSTVTLETDRRMDSITVQVLSRSSLQPIIEEHNLYPEERKVLPMEDVVAKMRTNVKVNLERPRPQWGMTPPPTAFHVLFTYPEPNIAARVTQQLGSRFLELNVKDRGALSGATSRFLDNQLTEQKTRLEQQEKKLEAFRQRYGKEMPTQLLANMQALASARTQAQGLVESAARDRDRKLLLERIYREAANEPAMVSQTPGTANTPNSLPVIGGTAQQQLLAAQTLLASLEQRYQVGHPDVARTRRLIAELEPKAAAEAAAVAAARPTGENGAPAPVLDPDPVRRERLRQMVAEIESLDRMVAFKENEERRVRSEISEYQRRIEAVPGLESEWVSLTRDYDTQQAQYKDLLTKASAAHVADELEQQEIGERFRVVDPAGVPVHPLPSIRGTVNMSGAGIGLLLGLVIAAFLELKDTSFKTESDVLEILAMPVLATVPRVHGAAEQKRQRQRAMILSVVGTVAIVVASYLTWHLKLWNSLT